MLQSSNRATVSSPITVNILDRQNCRIRCCSFPTGPRFPQQLRLAFGTPNSRLPACQNCRLPEPQDPILQSSNRARNSSTITVSILDSQQPAASLPEVQLPPWPELPQQLLLAFWTASCQNCRIPCCNLPMGPTFPQQVPLGILMFMRGVIFARMLRICTRRYIEASKPGEVGGRGGR